MSVVILSGLYASAQFLVFTELQKDEEDKYSVNSLSENLSFGYAITDKIYVGASMKDAVANTPEVIGVYADSTYAANNPGSSIGDTLTAPAAMGVDTWVINEMQFFARYYHTENLFLQLMTPYSTDDEGISATDLARVGAGYSFNIWNNLNVEAGYSMLIKADPTNEDRKGKGTVGLSMTF